MTRQGPEGFSSSDRNRFPLGFLRGRDRGEGAKTLALPRSQGTQAEVAGVWSHIHELRRKREGNKSFSIEARFPYVIGEVPPAERAAFDSFLGGDQRVDVLLSPDMPEWQDAMRQMPTVFGLVQNDLTLLGNSASLEQGELVRREMPDREIDWHLDRELFYLIANRAPTQFLEGKVSFGHDSTGAAKLGRRVKIASAAPYEIVRLDPATVHRLRFSETDTGFRTLFDLVTSINI